MNSIAFLSTAALKATVVFAAAFLLVLGLRRASAAARYFVWTSALVTALAIPILSLSVRPWKVAAVVMPQALATVDAAGSPAAGPSAPVTSPARSFGWLIPLWFCGVMAVVARMAIGHARVRLSIRRAPEIRDPAWLTALNAAAGRIGLRRRVELRNSLDTEVPVSYGLLRPVILLPAEFEEWSDDRRSVVLLHELTHIRRLDWLSCVISQLACAAYWFHPLAWLSVARFRQEQERSCDDAVVVAGTGQSAYAEHLVALASSLTAGRSSWPAAIGMAEANGLEQRVRALLDPRRKRRSLNGRVCLAALSAILVCAIPFAALRAQDAGPKVALSGTVVDASGAVVPNAVVLLKNANGKNQEIARSGAAGEYHFAAVAAGKYDVEVRSPGFAAYHQAALDLTGSNPARADFKLDIGTVSETVDVVGKGPRPVPAATTGTPHRIRVGGNVQATKLLHMTHPVYPADAQAAGIEGAVMLRAVISMQGDLLGLAVINTSVDPELAQAAIDAVKQWRYQPTLLNGAPVEVVTTITVNFRLEH